MSRTALRISELVLLAAILLLIPRDAQAYLDPGTGSYLFQLAVAGLLASMVTLRLYWQRVKDWFRPKPPPTDEPKP